MISVIFKILRKKILEKIIRENNRISMYEPRLNLRYYSHFGGRYHANHTQAGYNQAGSSSLAFSRWKINK